MRLISIFSVNSQLIYAYFEEEKMSNHKCKAHSEHFTLPFAKYQKGEAVAIWTQHSSHDCSTTWVGPALLTETLLKSGHFGKSSLGNKSLLESSSLTSFRENTLIQGHQRFDLMLVSV